MIDLNELTADLASDESSRRVVYDDATGLPLKPGMLLKGHPTIGVGRALDVNGLSQDEIAYLLKNDMTRISELLFEQLPWLIKFDSVRQSAVIEMAFNVGVHGLLGFHDTLSLIAAGNYDAAAEAMLASKWALQVGARARRLAEMIRSGQPVKR